MQIKVYQLILLYSIFGALVGIATHSWEWGGVAAVGAIVGFTYAKVIG